ncbi:MAG: AbrB/MazE/SpoVT family DNA-binding domain-containing protein [Desulfurococcales archaeon]|nr:AbrB/MazE/SpoVT family DNA-binding domain-containing protein [Desulfurococcales archaeon]
MARRNGRGNGQNILYRKIQRLGASSLIVTLPKDWVRRHGVKVGDILSVYDEGDKLVIAPNGDSYKIKLRFGLNHTHVERHTSRIILCSYVFGLDRVTFYSNKTIKKDIVDRILKMQNILEGIRINLNDDSIEIDMPKHNELLMDVLIQYGREISRLYSLYHTMLRTNKLVSKEELEAMYNRLMRLNYKLLRIANSVKSINKMHERKCRYMVSASNLIGIVADSTYKLGLDILQVIDTLSENEKERLAVLLELMEVAVSTIVNSLKPPSVKKSEESYMKIKTIISMEDDMGKIIEESSPGFAYLLAKIIEIARILEIAEHIMLCNAIYEKYNESPSLPRNVPM